MNTSTQNQQQTQRGQQTGLSQTTQPVGPSSQLSATSGSEGYDFETTRQLAYSLWEEAGCPEGGDGTEFWYRAEQQLASPGS